MNYAPDAMDLDDFGPPPPDATPVAQLIRHWMDERNSPDILPMRHELVQQMLENLSEQVREQRLPVLISWRAE